MTATKPGVLFGAHDPGGANAVVGLASRLAAMPQLRVHCLVKNFAEHIFVKRGLLTIDCPTATPSSIRQCLESIHKSTPLALVVTGTSEQEAVEHTIWEWAAESGVPSLAVVDYWSKYPVRFSRDRNALAMDILPDEIAVMDDQVKLDLIELGMPAEKILVTGQPYLDDIFSWKQNRDDIIAKTRAKFGFSEVDKLITFVSEPARKMDGSSALDAGFLGFTEVDALRIFLGALTKLALRRADLRIHALVKLHPKEELSDFDWLESEMQGKPKSFNLRLVKEFPPRDLVLASDVTVGMMSMLLVEACILGGTVLSVQPGLIGEDMLITNSSGHSIRCDDVQSLVNSMERSLSPQGMSRPNATPFTLLDGQSLNRLERHVLARISRLATNQL